MFKEIPLLTKKRGNDILYLLQTKGEMDFLFYRYFIRIHAIPYGEIRKAYLRIESGESGDLPVTEHYLMLKDKREKMHKLRMEHPEDTREALSYLEEHFPDIEIGHYKKEERV